MRLSALEVIFISVFSIKSLDLEILLFFKVGICVQVIHLCTFFVKAAQILL